MNHTSQTAKNNFYNCPMDPIQDTLQK